MRIGLMLMLFEREIEWIGALHPNINDKNCSNNNNATDEQILFPSHDIYKLVTTIRSKDKPISQEVLATQPCAHSCSSEIGRNDETEKDKPQYLNCIHTTFTPIILCTVWQQINCESTQKMHTSIICGQFIDFFFLYYLCFYFFAPESFFVSSLTVFFISSSHAYNNQNRPRKKRMHTHTRNGSIQTNKKVFFVYDFNNRRIRNN